MWRGDSILHLSLSESDIKNVLNIGNVNLQSCHKTQRDVKGENSKQQPLPLVYFDRVFVHRGG